MGRIHLTTFIGAPVERVFDLSRHIGVFKFLYNGKNERLRSGAASNMLEKDETVSIFATHGRRTRMLMLKLTLVKRPLLFIEEQIRGDLDHFKHEHHFKSAENGTIVIDLLDYGRPKDIIGRILGGMYLRNYLEELVRRRNDLVRNYAETEKWRALLL